MVRDLVCFCSPCVTKNWEACWNTSHALPWSLIKLKPINNRLVCHQMEEYEDHEEWEFGGHGEDLLDLLQAGDNFVILAIEGNDVGVDFDVLQCQRAKFMVHESFQCVWGCHFDVGDHVVTLTYYQKWGRGSQNYVFLNQSRTTYIDAHLVKDIKFR